jgi:hypothetical protein
LPKKANQSAGALVNHHDKIVMRRQNPAEQTSAAKIKNLYSETPKDNGWKVFQNGALKTNSKGLKRVARRKPKMYCISFC